MTPVRFLRPTSTKGAPEGQSGGVEAGPVVLVARVGAAAGSRAAAAALACAASEPDRAALLVDLEEGGRRRSTLVATSGARALEERLVAHMPDAAIASRGRFCQLTLAPQPTAIESLAAALPLSREAAAVVHLPPDLLRAVLVAPSVRPSGVLLRADLAEDRALTALAVRDLIDRGLRAAVLKRRLGWMTERAALLGALPGNAQGIPRSLSSSLPSRA
jgi:hypothetical protein